jgi:hypothetical protein
MPDQLKPTTIPDQILPVPPSPPITISREEAISKPVDYYVAEIERLNRLVCELTKERDDYRRAAEIWAAAQISEADIERYGRDEPGVPLEAFIDELEQSAKSRRDV